MAFYLVRYTTEEQGSLRPGLQLSPLNPVFSADHSCPGGDSETDSGPLQGAVRTEVSNPLMY